MVNDLNACVGEYVMYGCVCVCERGKMYAMHDNMAYLKQNNRKRAMEMLCGSTSS